MKTIVVLASLVNSILQDYHNMDEKLVKDKLIWSEVCSKYCPRCVLRHLCHDWKVIAKSESKIRLYLKEKYDLKSLWKEENEPPSKKRKTDISSYLCLGCIGILQSSLFNLCVKSVTEAISSECYEFKCFQNKFHLPLPLMVSEQAAVSHFKELFGEENVEKEPHNVKEVLKVLLEPLVSSELGVERQIDGNFEISLFLSHAQGEAKVLEQLKKKSPQSFQSDKKRFRKKVPPNEEPFTVAKVNKAIAAVSSNELRELISELTSSCELQVKLFHTPIFVGGRYNKYTRSLPQTPWILDGERKLENSVEEHLAKLIQKAFKADGYNFSSSGREDVDVRMLGNGRPFLIELINPRVETLPNEDMKAIESEINNQTDDVSASHLQIVDKADCKVLKQGEAEKTKSYSAICYFLSPPTEEQLEKLSDLSKLTDVEIKQQTPIRVLHRRPVATRPRLVHSINAKRVENGDPRLFKLNLSTQAGTYVKEFVHGDFGRTSPSLKDLINAEVDIIDLDVMSVDIQWPPRLS